MFDILVTALPQIRAGKALERKTTPSAPCLNQPNPYDWLDHSHALEVP